MINVGNVTQSVSTTVGKKPKGNTLSDPKLLSDIPDNVIDQYAEMMEVFDDEGNSTFIQSTKNADPGPHPIDFDDMHANIVVDDATQKSAQAGKQAAANVVRSTPRSTASLNSSAANTVSQSIVSKKNIKMNALMLGLGGGAAGYSYSRNKRR